MTFHAFMSLCVVAFAFADFLLQNVSPLLKIVETKEHLKRAETAGRKYREHSRRYLRPAASAIES